MKKAKKITALILTLFMLWAVVPVNVLTVFASGITGKEDSMRNRKRIFGLQDRSNTGAFR